MVTGLCLISFISPLSASQQADVPEWELGQTWAMGHEVDIGEMYESMLGHTDDMVEYNEHFESVDMSVSGEMGFYQLYKITEVTEKEYTMLISTGGGVHLSSSFWITGMVEKEGTYDWDENWEDIPKEKKTYGGDFDVHFTSAIDGEARFERDTLALKSVEYDSSFSIKVDIQAENLPDYDFDWEENTREVKYTDMDVKIDGSLYLSMDVGFEPALDIFNFPINVGEEWAVESLMTISGTYSGQIDASGLPDEYMEEMENEGYSFPITFEDLEIPGGELEDGIILETKVPISFDMKCVGTEEVELEDGSTTDVFLIHMYPDFTLEEETRGEDEYGEGYIHGYADGYLTGETDSDEGEEYSCDYTQKEFDDYSMGYSDGYSMGYLHGYNSMPYDDSHSYYGDWDDDFGTPQLVFVMKYSPEKGFIVSQGMMIEGMGMFPVDMSSMDMEPMNEAYASRRMEFMQQMPSDSSFWDMFFSSTALFILGVIIGVLIVVVFVVKKKGGKKTVYYAQPPYGVQTQLPQRPSSQADRESPPSQGEQFYSKDHRSS